MTDKDVQGKMEKLCSRYREAAAAVHLLQPVEAPTRRRQSRVEERVATVLGRLQRARRPQSAALVRLAYVRGMRSVLAGARLGPLEEAEVSELAQQLDSQLKRVENAQWHSYRDRLRRLRLASTMEEMDIGDELLDAMRVKEGSYPMEQRARASVQVAVEVASGAGAKAATRSSSYDERDAA